MTVNCSVCSKAVISPGCKFKGKVYHQNCFKCEGCFKGLASQKFVEKEGKILCGQCYTEKHGIKCTQCDSAIIGEDGLIQHFGKFYHSKCFECTDCKKNIANEQFVSEGENHVCLDCAKKK